MNFKDPYREDKSGDSPIRCLCFEFLVAHAISKTAKVAQINGVFSGARKTDLERTKKHQKTLSAPKKTDLERFPGIHV